MTTALRIKRDIKREEDIQRFHNLILASQSALQNMQGRLSEMEPGINQDRQKHAVDEMREALKAILCE